MLHICYIYTHYIQIYVGLKIKLSQPEVSDEFGIQFQKWMLQVLGVFHLLPFVVAMWFPCAGDRLCNRTFSFKNCGKLPRSDLFSHVLLPKSPLLQFFFAVPEVQAIRSWEPWLLVLFFAGIIIVPLQGISMISRSWEVLTEDSTTYSCSRM